MIELASRRLIAKLCTWDPHTNVYGLARTLLAGATLLTLLMNSTTVLFLPASGGTMGPTCDTPTSQFSIFCLLVDHLELARWLAIVILAVTASGWRPRFTGILHWWISYGVHVAVTPVDGGEQACKNLCLLLIPICLLDGRKWHWQPSRVETTIRTLISRVIILTVFVAIQLQVSVIYFHAALAKLGVQEWRDGTAMYYILSSPAFGASEPWLAVLLPVLKNGTFVAMLTWSVVLVEFTLAAGFMSSGYWRKALLVSGLTLHLGILLLQGISSFSVIMFGALLLYLRPWAEDFRPPTFLTFTFKQKPLFHHRKFVGFRRLNLPPKSSSTEVR